jgi:hypothetical protein
MEDRSELLTCSEGASILDIRGDSFDALLLIDGSPVVLQWCDCEGSVGQYLVRAGIRDIERLLGPMRAALDGKLNSKDSLESQISPVMAMLTPGQYKIEFRHTTDVGYFSEFNSKWSVSTDRDQFYPVDDNSIVLTRPLDSLNEVRIRYFQNLIERGHRPIAITLSTAEGWSEYVIDGHHKLQAYRLLNVSPSLIRIVRLDPETLPLTAMEDIQIGPHPLASHYRINKADNGCAFIE